MGKDSSWFSGAKQAGKGLDSCALVLLDSKMSTCKNMVLFQLYTKAVSGCHIDMWFALRCKINSVLVCRL